ncbi:MAG: PIN domain-containing protein [Roseiflexaceae bacterium]|nr:PIN domain-containing protein [Roseiflexus sp.]MCS7289763.1 PIN domain-containing protein [Roseiflexus sp.]MDW8145755.1 PIN domain-containing protein [Roseiflexaceae bacterium]MDW8215697.1 PIN domain-containing protein [Roseiflexaceae bacterium]
MGGLLDTSTIVRYLTGQPPDLAMLAAQIIDSEEHLLIPEVVIAETAYVLTSGYGVPREAVVDTLILLLQKRNIFPFALRKETLLQALLLCRPSGRISFADALVWAAASETENKVVYSLDARFPHDGIEVRRSRTS